MGLQKFTYNLLEQVSSELDLLCFKEEIAEILRRYGAKNIRIYKRGYSFMLPEKAVFTNQMKRDIGREIAAIEGIGMYAIIYPYKYKSGKKGTSVQLFRIQNSYSTKKM